MHTVHHFRNEHWNPGIWSRQMLGPWLAGDRSLDADVARDRALAFEAKAGPARADCTAMSAALEAQVLRIIEHARAGLDA
jgi:hypothetical protein